MVEDTLLEWYELFSRGARDWLRHNEKLAESVKKALPDIIKSGDAISGTNNRTVKIPYRMLEHYRFILAKPENETGVGQGNAKPGDTFGQPDKTGNEKGEGGGEGHNIIVEMKVDDIVDWLWDELKLPNLKPKDGQSEDVEYIREGIDKKGARSRLDRRLTIKQMHKRQVFANAVPTLIDDDLRFRQLKKRKQPGIDAVVFFLMDVSGSMTSEDRKKAKSFFFWTIQGLRKQYKHIKSVFVAHTTEAEEFDEEAFFSITGNGGTVTSTGLKKVNEILNERYNHYTNRYLFYVSDGDNASTDKDDAVKELETLMEKLTFAGYMEVSVSSSSLIKIIWEEVKTKGKSVDDYRITNYNEVFDAVKHFFTEAD